MDNLLEVYQEDDASQNESKHEYDMQNYDKSRNNDISSNLTITINRYDLMNAIIEAYEEKNKELVKSLKRLLDKMLDDELKSKTYKTQIKILRYNKDVVNFIQRFS